MAARTAQGLEEWASSTRDEQMEVLRRWQEIQLGLGPSSLKAEADMQTQILNGYQDETRGQSAGNTEKVQERLTPIQHLGASSEVGPNLSARPPAILEIADVRIFNRPIQSPIASGRGYDEGKGLLSAKGASISEDNTQPFAQSSTDDEPLPQVISRKPIPRKAVAPSTSETSATISIPTMEQEQVPEIKILGTSRIFHQLQGG
ncbi:MAG: hypothetical protein Q9207_006619 [Kuettlingeria erythrocarpa]